MISITIIANQFLQIKDGSDVICLMTPEDEDKVLKALVEVRIVRAEREL